MSVFIRMVIYSTVTVVLVYLVCGIVIKTKTCVEFQAINYSLNVSILGQRHGIMREECMTSCIRSKVSCGAINFRMIDGACEFLPYQTCMSPQETVETDGTNVVQLGQCDGVPPGIGLLTSTEHRLKWLTSSEIGARSVFVMGADRKVARVIYKGMYLPGFTTRKGAFKAYDGKRNLITCTNAIQYLTYSNTADYVWIHFTVGNQVPVKAIIGGYWPNGSPLYIVKTVPGGGVPEKCGYYNPTTQQSYIQQAGVENGPGPQELEMLLENWLVLVSNFILAFLDCLQLLDNDSRCNGLPLNISFIIVKRIVNFYFDAVMSSRYLICM